MDRMTGGTEKEKLEEEQKEDSAIMNPMMGEQHRPGQEVETPYGRGIVMETRNEDGWV